MLKKSWLKIKEYLKKFWDILIGNDKNWDGKVDIKDDLIKAKEKAQGAKLRRELWLDKEAF